MRPTGLALAQSFHDFAQDHSQSANRTSPVRYEPCSRCPSTRAVSIYGDFWTSQGGSRPVAGRHLGSIAVRHHSALVSAIGIAYHVEHMAAAAVAGDAV